MIGCDADRGSRQRFPALPHGDWRGATLVPTMFGCCGRQSGRATTALDVWPRQPQVATPMPNPWSARRLIPSGRVQRGRARPPRRAAKPRLPRASCRTHRSPPASVDARHPDHRVSGGYGLIAPGSDRTATTLSSSHSVVSEAAGFRPTRSWKVDTGGSPRWRRAGMNSRLNRMVWGSVESSAERTRH